MDLLLNTPIVIGIGPMLAVDGVTPKTGLAFGDVTVTLRKAGAAGAGKALTALNWVEDSGGYYLLGLAAGDVDTLGQLQIDIAASATLPYWESYFVASSVGGVAGPGHVPWPYRVRDAAGNGIADVEVRISTDAAGTVWVAGPLRTNDFGWAEPEPRLFAGTYYFWCRKANVGFATNPDAETVVES